MILQCAKTQCSKNNPRLSGSPTTTLLNNINTQSHQDKLPVRDYPGLLRHHRQKYYPRFQYVQAPYHHIILIIPWHLRVSKVLRNTIQLPVFRHARRLFLSAISSGQTVLNACRELLRPPISALHSSLAAQFRILLPG